ncbi:MAG: GtrA family protein [Gammaproteobacteria bacterium]|nr:GtrA family protein [Gammaproteobacteria bacterium]
MLLQLIRFALSGGLATASHWFVMVLLINTGTTSVTATAVGAFIGAIVNYILQYKITFQSNAAHRSTVQPYIAVCTLMWIANLLFFLILHHTIQLSTIHAQGITSFVVALMSYFLYKRIVFNDPKSQPV